MGASTHDPDANPTPQLQLPSFGARGGLATKEVRSDSTEDAFGDVRDMEVIAPHSSSNGGEAEMI